MLHSQNLFQIARRGVEAGAHWLGFLFHFVLGAVALAVALRVLSHSPIVHGLAAVAGRWLKTVNLFDLVKGIFK
jgi:hypothetical protein